MFGHALPHTHTHTHTHPHTHAHAHTHTHTPSHARTHTTPCYMLVHYSVTVNSTVQSVNTHRSGVPIYEKFLKVFTVLNKFSRFSYKIDPQRIIMSSEVHLYWMVVNFYCWSWFLKASWWCQKRWIWQMVLQWSTIIMFVRVAIKKWSSRDSLVTKHALMRMFSSYEEFAANIHQNLMLNFNISWRLSQVCSVTILYNSNLLIIGCR